MTPQNMTWSDALLLFALAAAILGVFEVNWGGLKPNWVAVAMTLWLAMLLIQRL